MGYGMTLGFPTLLIPILSKQDNGEPFFLKTEGLSWIGSIGMICVPLGAVISGLVTQPLGRKKSMQLINIPFCVAWLFYYFSNKIWHIFIALIINGLAGGLMEAPVLTYVAEICQPHLRGMLGSASTMSVIAGMMIQFILGTFLKWRSVALCCGVMPIVSFNLYF
ncbi:hypothetical protein WA026_008097 [Henosepilachna vigintioctopunctata]|uniref:Major facilitator superfamily (MFS) profile domain-containing protein n=1 Tax=Henosepilachna vigintioctopunctata TaxID=420089 RepID=A0AAW1TKR7_9CUCU